MKELVVNEELKKELIGNKKYNSIGLPSDMTIGIEIESEGKSSNVLLNFDNVLSRWNIKEDITLNNGVEVVSPILNDCEDDISEIYVICGMLKKLGQYVTDNCGGHVHIGASYLKSKQSFINLFKIWKSTEDILIKISNEEGDVPRNSIYNYAKSVSGNISKYLDSSVNIENETDIDEFIFRIKKIQATRDYGLNILNVSDVQGLNYVNSKNTIEFRISNSSLDGNTWVDNIRLFGRIVYVSELLVRLSNKNNLTKEEMLLLEVKDKLVNGNSDEEDRLELLLSLLFKDSEKEIYRNRYYTNSMLINKSSYGKK